MGVNRIGTVCSMVCSWLFWFGICLRNRGPPERGRGTGAKAAQRAGIRSGPAKRPAEPTLCGGRAAVLVGPFRFFSRSALEAEASRHRVLPRGRVKDTRAALIEQVRETRLVLAAAQFALTERESSDFAKKGSHYAYGDTSNEDPAGEKEAGGDGGETVEPSIAPDEADVDQEEEDETADSFASAEDANLEGDGGDLDDIAPPPIDTVDRADAAYDARA